MTIVLAEQVRTILKRGLKTSWLLGQVDGAAGAMLSGWAFSPRAPRRRLTILVESMPGVFATVRADLYRADVHHAGRGTDGYCGFRVPLRQIGWPGPLRVLVSETLRPVPGSPWVGAGPSAIPPARGRGGLRFLVQRRGSVLAGWVFAAADPFDRRRLRLECDGHRVARATACLFDARSTGPDRDGFHGFSIAAAPAGRPSRLVDEASGTVLHEERG